MVLILERAYKTKDKKTEQGRADKERKGGTAVFGCVKTNQLPCLRSHRV